MKFDSTRLNKFRTSLNEKQIDVAFISDFKTIQYLTTFGSDPFERILAMLIFADQDPFVFAPALEEQVILNTGWPFAVYPYQDDQDGMTMLMNQIKVRNTNPLKVGTEKANITADKYERLMNEFNEADFTENITPIIEHQKLFKETDEIAKLIQAGRDADLAFEAGFKALEAGKTELQIAAALEYATKLRNVPEMSFGTLVQGGAHAADPHGETSSRVLKENELVLFDLGTVYEGYISDATRTVSLGEPTDFMREIHSIVLEAQLAAQDAVKPGIAAAELDSVARDVITNAGYGQYFIHR
ncbi:MAG: Xaa-Pro peptidase family protein, partial [Lactobacillaceae bacterium]|nr:Xaa-Pro peptidase family protein [Lactobacillaceae bacterium]